MRTAPYKCCVKVHGCEKRSSPLKTLDNNKYINEFCLSDLNRHPNAMKYRDSPKILAKK